MKHRLAPLTGVAFIVVAIIAFAVGGEPPGADEPVQEIVDFYVDDKDSVEFGAALIAAAAVFFVIFAGYLRNVLRAAEGERGFMSSVVLAGAAIMAVGVGIDATISFALAEAADDIEPTAVQALQALWDNDFMPIAIGITLFLLAAGISIAGSGALPKWLGWVAIVLAVVGMTPAGFIAFMGGALWVLAVSILLAVRAERPSPAAPA